MNNICNEKRAFTLAETLITITIIGVVMALMLRAINRVNPDKDKIQFIKTYHALESVIADVINDPKKYDQSFYTDQEIADMTADSLHIDFRYKPYETGSSDPVGIALNDVEETEAGDYPVGVMLSGSADINRVILKGQEAGAQV